MTIDKATIEQINASIDLIEYASQQMNLIKRGKDYFCSCPLHEDKTPSLSFNSERNLFYCFSCGKGGGIINYLQYFEGLSYEDAVGKAMKLAHIDGSSLCKSNTLSFLSSIKEENNQSYNHKMLDKSIYNSYSKEPIKLWLEEGINQDVMDLYEIRIDKQCNRIVYPVYDNNGNFINIKGRTMLPNFKELGLPKYINYYPVGVVDYFQGMGIARNYINNEVIVFESLKSVMKVFGWGYRNCISAEKHSLTKEQVDILLELNKDVILAYDADVDYYSNDIQKSINMLKRFVNVYIITNVNNVLGEKDAPADCGREVWEFLYNNKRKI